MNKSPRIFNNGNGAIGLRRVAVVYPHYPHYRRPVFDCLRNSINYEFEFLFSLGSPRKGIKLERPNPADKVLPVFRARNILFQFGAFSDILSSKYDVYIFLGNPYILSTWVYASIARLRGIPVLFWTHGWLRKEVGLKGRIRKVFYSLASGLLLYGERARTIGISEGFDPLNLHVIYNSLDYNEQNSRRIKLEREERAQQTHPYFVCVARLSPELEMELAFLALAQLEQSKGLRTKLVLIGGGECESELKATAKLLNLDVDFRGPIYDEDIIAHEIFNAVAVLSPGKVGLTAMHALAYGTPIITHGDFDEQMPEVEAITPGVTGDFFERGNPKDLAEIMLKWLALGENDEMHNLAIRTIEAKYTPIAQRNFIELALNQHLNK